MRNDLFVYLIVFLNYHLRVIIYSVDRRWRYIQCIQKMVLHSVHTKDGVTFSAERCAMSYTKRWCFVQCKQKIALYSVQTGDGVIFGVDRRWRNI